MEMPTAAFWMQIPRTAGLGEAPFDHLPGRSSNRRHILVSMLGDRDGREPRGGAPCPPPGLLVAYYGGSSG
jgi:hypothetical protein